MVGVSMGQQHGIHGAQPLGQLSGRKGQVDERNAAVVVRHGRRVVLALRSQHRVDQNSFARHLQQQCGVADKLNLHHRK